MYSAEFTSYCYFSKSGHLILKFFVTMLLGLEAFTYKKISCAFQLCKLQ